MVVRVVMREGMLYEDVVRAGEVRDLDIVGMRCRDHGFVRNGAGHRVSGLLSFSTRLLHDALEQYRQSGKPQVLQWLPSSE